MVLTTPSPHDLGYPWRLAHRHRGPVPLGPSKWLREALGCEGEKREGAGVHRMVLVVTEVTSRSWFRSKGGTLGRSLVGFTEGRLDGMIGAQ